MISGVQIKKYFHALDNIDLVRSYGEVTKVVGLIIESKGPQVHIGEICKVFTKHEKEYVEAEVVGFKDDKILLMPFDELKGICQGSRVVSTNEGVMVPVGMNLKGRVLNGLGKPIDNLGSISVEDYYSTDNTPPNPLTRNRITEPVSLGIRAIDGLLTCGSGQRIGIFAGSGVGKSTLLGMIARNTNADINVIVLVGERGREVNEFIIKDLQEEGLKKSVLVVATSDQPALVRLKSAMLGTAIAEYFRDEGLNVMLLMDSLTRFAMAQREIGLAVGEPPVARGYTPSVFSILPKLLERSGTSDKGTITGLYTVLVDGDDLNEPITDAVRGILDGHIVLSRDLANSNHYPAIDVLASVSRVMPNIVSKNHLNLSNQIKKTMATYEEARDLINIGAYKKGSNPDIDYSISKIKNINTFLRQDVDEVSTFDDTLESIETMFGVD